MTTKWRVLKTEEEWHAFRNTGVGGSDVPAILGTSPYASAYSIGMRKMGLVPPPETKEIMWWGKVLEPLIVKRLTMEKPSFYVERAVEGTWGVARSTRWPWMISTVDGLIDDMENEDAGQGVLEVKRATYLRRSELEDEKDTRRVAYEQQLLHNMDVTGLSWGVVAVLAGNELVWWRMSYDAARAARIRDATSAFWKCVEARELPEPDGSKATAEAMATAWPEAAAGKEVRLDDAAAAAWDMYLEAGREMKKLEKQQNEARNAIAAALKDAEYGAMPDGRRLRFKTVHHKESVVKAYSYRFIQQVDANGKVITNKARNAEEQTP
jgi:putative phage-type endonuclease